MKELLFVCIGSFFGGGMRYLVALLHERLTGPSAVAYGTFPWATFAVNVIQDCRGVINQKKGNNKAE